MTPLDHALAYAALGWRVIPIPPGHKHPFGIADWQTKATTDEARIRRHWAKHPDHGIGIACGPGSGIVAIDIDPRHGGDESWAMLEVKYGAAPETVEAVTGRNGRHLVYRHPTDGPTITNAAHAMPPGIDVRGDGGQIVVAPSIHPISGQAYAWEVAHDPLDGFQVAEMPPWLLTLLRTPQPEQVARRDTPTYVGADSIIGLFMANHTWPELLEAKGWTFHSRRCNHLTGELYELWTRPGKSTREGASASLYYGGTDVLKVFTSSAAPLEQDATYTRFGFYAAYEHGGDHKAASGAYRRTLNGSAPRDHVIASAPEPPPGVDPVTGEVQRPTGGLDDDFWSATPTLEHIRQAARARMVAPASVLASVLARVAAFTPPSTCLPPIIGGVAPLSLFLALYGASGGGKSAPGATAAELLPVLPPGCVGPLGLGSGEGLVQAYCEMVEETIDGKKVRVNKQTRRGALFNLDEGQLLAEISTRKGSTILPTLRTAWSGGNPGQANASAETYRHLTPGSYSLGLVSLWQHKAAMTLLADTDGGTPQRFVWLPVTDPDADWTCRPDWPGALDWRPPTAYVMNGVVGRHPLGVVDEVVDEIGEHHAAKLRGEVVEDTLDAHRRLNKLKIAGCLVVLEGRQTITVDDWGLAERIMSVSDGIRGWVLAEARRAREDSDKAAAKRAVERDEMIQSGAHTRSLDRAARAAWRACSKADGGVVSRRQIHDSIAARDRKVVSVDEAIEYAVALRWLVAKGVDGWSLGPVKPS